MLHEPEVEPDVEPPAKKLKQAAAQPKRKAPANENARPAAGTKRKEVERKVGTCTSTVARLSCRVLRALCRICSQDELIELAFTQRPPWSR